MKSLFILPMLLILCLFSYSQKNKSINGTWKLVSAKNGSLPTAKVAEATPQVNYIKIFGPKHFVAVTYLNNGNAVRTIGGTYQLKKDQYTEDIVYADEKNNLQNTQSVFSIKLEKNKMYISGKIANGNLDLSEVWERVE